MIYYKEHNAGIEVFENATKISSIMLDSDIAISTGGSTLYELCACGVPTIGFMIAENQRGILEKMNEVGCVLSLGEYLNIRGNLLEAVKYLISNTQTRKRMADSGRKLVDANAAQRVAEIILKSL